MRVSQPLLSLTIVTGLVLLLQLQGCTSMTTEPMTSTGKVWRFDFGPPPDQASIPNNLPEGNFMARYLATRKTFGLVQEGWTPVHTFSDYHPDQGFGWVDKDRKLELPYERNDALNPIFHQGETEPLYKMLVDGLTSRKGAGATARLRVDAPPGRYKISVYLGDLSLGEARSDMGASVNGHAIFRGVNTAGGQTVKQSRVIESTSPFLIVTFTTGKGAQLSVCGMTIEPAPLGETAQGEVRYPTHAPKGAMTMNLAHQIKRDSAEVDGLVKQLDSRGVPAQPPSTHGGTRLFATMYGDPSRLMAVDPSLDVTPLASLLKRLGVDMVAVRNPGAAMNYRRNGLVTLDSVHAEGFPPNSGEPVLQKLRNKAGALSEEKGFYSLFAPSNRKALASAWRPKGALRHPVESQVFVDEPRGLTAIGGRLGDYGPDALDAFNAWARANRPGFLSATRLPTPAISADFYDFFLFRLQAVPEFLSAVGQEAGFRIEKLWPGNGELGPASVNHSTFFPPEIAKRHMSVGTWNYLEPWQVKRSAEVVAAAGREYGVPSAVYTMCGSDDVINRCQALAALSARPSVIGPREGTSFRLFLELSAMTRALGSAEHETGVLLYWPASLTYPDLSTFTNTEGRRWDELARSFYDGNLDFKVTYRCDASKPSLLVYAPQQAILSDDEVRDLRAYLEKGGTLVYASESALLRPDGTPRGTAEEVLSPQDSKKIVRLKGLPSPAQLRMLAKRIGVMTNPDGCSDKLKTFTFLDDNATLLMLQNSDPVEATTIKLPTDAVDGLTGKPIDSGTLVTVQPGFFRLIRLQSVTRLSR